ncbi:MAG: hypothetical protein ACHQUB_02580 [Candidatus Saccharimonadia bacterium]
MMLPLIIEVAITIASFFLGFLVAEIYQWLRIRSNRRNVPIQVVPSQPIVQTNLDVALPEGFKEKLQSQTQADYSEALKASAQRFIDELQSTSELLNGQIKNLATGIIGNELEQYQSELAQARAQAISDLGQLQTAINEQKSKMEADLMEEIKSQKQLMLSQIDTKLGDAVGSFLVETLQHNVDLGAQNTYIMAMLEEHKAELKRELNDEV